MYMDTAEQVKTKNSQTDFVDAAGQLIAYLKEAHQTEDATMIFVMAAYISKMDEKMNLAMKQITELQEQMRQMQDDQSKESKKLTEYLGEITEALRVQHNDVRAEVEDIKLTFSNQTNRILERIKKTGVVALNGVAENFKMETRLQKLKEKIETMLSGTEQAIERINTFGRNMQDAKRQAGNAFRALLGRQEYDSAQKDFLMAETLKKPFLMQQKLLKETLSCVNRVLGKCTQLSTAARENPEKTEGEKDKKKAERSADTLEKVADKTEIKRKVKSR